MKKEERKKVKVHTKIAVIIQGYYFPPGSEIEFDAEDYERIDDIVKFSAFELIEEAGDEQAGG